VCITGGTGCVHVQETPAQSNSASCGSPVNSSAALLWLRLTSEYTAFNVGSVGVHDSAFLSPFAMTPLSDTSELPRDSLIQLLLYRADLTPDSHCPAVVAAVLFAASLLTVCSLCM
jgi:hypothetical protein